jgi:hypothetical protein
MDSDPQLSRERKSKLRIEAARRQWTVRQAVIAPDARHNLRSSRREHRRLQGCSDRIGSGRSKEDASSRSRIKRSEALAHVDFSFRRVEVPEREPELVTLDVDRIANSFRSMA